MALVGFIIFIAIWTFILAPIALAIPKDQTWLEREHKTRGIGIFLFWPYFIIRNYAKNKEQNK